MNQLRATAERKSLSATVEDVDTDAPHGGFTAVLSTPSRDRDGEVLKSQEWVTPLPERITLDADHGMSVATTIGSARPYFDSAGRLMIDAKFSSIPRAQEVRTLVKEGHISTVSVAALVDHSVKGAPRRELLNAGVVAVPANRDSVILASKSVVPQWFQDAVVKATSGDAEGAMVQAIHDASSHLGAACASDWDYEDERDDLSEDGSDGSDDGVNKSLAMQALRLRIKALAR